MTRFTETNINIRPSDIRQTQIIRPSVARTSGGGGKGLKEKELGARAEGGEKMPPSFKEILLAERPFPKKKAEPTRPSSQPEGYK